MGEDHTAELRVLFQFSKGLEVPPKGVTLLLFNVLSLFPRPDQEEGKVVS